MSARQATTLILISGVIAGLLLAFSIYFGLAARPAAAQSTAAPTTPRQIVTIGTGEVRGTPDTASVQIGVETTAATTQEALARNNSQLNALIAKLKELEIAEKDIQTSNFSIYPTYDNNGREVTGYTVNNSVTVVIRNLARAGTLLDDVVEVGANRIYGISFSVADPAALLAQAREQAVADARLRAAQLAKASGGTVGAVLLVSESIGASPMPVPQMADRAESAGAPIQAGEQAFAASVQVTFELK
jgi:hypothetical protein